MHVSFTEEELQWIVKDLFNWHIAKDCPKDKRAAVQKKLDLVNKAKTI